MSSLKRVYESVYNYFGGNEASISVIGSFLVIFVTFWTLGLLFLWVDITGSPRFLLKFKVQKYQKPDATKLMKAIRLALVNTVFWNSLVGLVMWKVQKALGCSLHPDDVPSLPRILVDLAACALMEEAIFYYSHRLLHHPVLYKHIHKVHHEWTAPIGIVAIYAHPIEYLTSNAFLVVTGPLVMRSHMVTFWIWCVIAISVTVVRHSGFHLPLMPSPQFHDYHHLKFNCNYGTSGLLDKLHGTDKMFKEDQVVSKRHRMFVSLQPISQLYPDVDKSQ